MHVSPIRLVSAAVALAVVMFSVVPAAAQPPLNGYAELVRAAELLSKSRLFPKVADGRATLAAQREALAEKPVRDALQLLERSLGRPIVAAPPASSVDAPMKDSAAARSLGRLLLVQQYVLLSQGRTRDALLNARLGLRLATAAQGDTMITGLTGIGIGAAGIRALGRHLEQLSLSDCGLLHQVCVEWLNRPDPMLRVLNGEWQFSRRTLAAQFEQAAAEPLPGASPEAARRARQATGELLSAATKEIDALYARIFEELRKPPWERTSIPSPSGQDPGAVLAGTLVPVLNRATDSYTREMAQIRILACHAAVLRFRWEQNRLPASLDELQLGSIGTDPFTGEPLQYEKAGERAYRLTSAGPRAAADDAAAVNGRKPVSVM